MSWLLANYDSSIGDILRNYQNSPVVILIVVTDLLVFQGQSSPKLLRMAFSLLSDLPKDICSIWDNTNMLIMSVLTPLLSFSYG